MDKRVKFRNVLFKNNLTQRDVSKGAKVPEVYISQFVNGRYNLDEAQRMKIAKFLGMPEGDLFDDDK